MNYSLLFSLSHLFFLGFGESLNAQDIATLPRADRISSAEPVPKKSPMNSASVKVGKAYMRVVYSQPMLRGRAMLGDQVKFGKVWRAGANEATEVYVTAPLKVQGRTLPAGAYSLFIIPNEKEWTIIFNRQLGEWGAYSYDEEKDALRVDVPVAKNKEPFEAFTIYFDDMNMVFVWGKTKVEMPFKFGIPAARGLQVPASVD